jgi:hypothetical protein
VNKYAIERLEVKIETGSREHTKSRQEGTMSFREKRKPRFGQT